MPWSQCLLVTLLKPEWPSPHLNLAVYPPTVWTPHPSTSPPPPSSATPVWKQVACQWWKEQLLEARRKWEAQQRSWCSNTLEGRKGEALSNVKTCVEVSVPFMEPIPKCARLMGTAISNVESCSTTASVPPPLSPPPCLTSSATCPQPWAELVRQVKNPAPVVQLCKPQKR